ncbi:DnaJ protein homolog 2-like protein [Tanacetum coccineum]
MTDMVKHDVDVESLDECVDEIDKLAELISKHEADHHMEVMRPKSSNYRKGSKSGASSRCPGCQGSGMRVTTQKIDLGMIQQMQHACPECRGSGESINEKDRCQPCKEKKVTQEKKVLEVHVEKGLQHSQKITFEGQANEAFVLTHLDGRQIQSKRTLEKPLNLDVTRFDSEAEKFGTEGIPVHRFLSFKELQYATNNIHISILIGEGSTVKCLKFYDGVLPDGDDNNTQNRRCEHHEGFSPHRYRCARNVNYDEALDLEAYVSKLSTVHPKFAFTRMSSHYWIFTMDRSI